MRVLFPVLLLLSTAAVPAQEKAVSLKPQAKIAEDIQALPRVVPNATVAVPIATKINASLARFDAEMRKDWRDCQRDGKENADWSRTVEITMRGPGYLSLTIEDAYDCGTPSMQDFETALVYDLQTGLPVNWDRLLPHEAKGEIIRSPGRLSIGDVSWPAMVTRAKRQSMKGDGGADCADAYKDPEWIHFQVFLRPGAVILAPSLTSHYNSAMCSTEVAIDPAEAKRLGIAQPLIDAITAAH